MVGYSLLDLVQYESRGAPLFVEVPVNPELSPILVSSTQSLIWVSDRDGLVRAAFREDLDSFFNEIIKIAYKTGLENGWQNSSDLSQEGLQSGLDFLNYYNIPEGYCLLRSKGAPNIPFDLKDLEVVEVDWLKETCVILTSKDKSYLGTLILHTDRRKLSGYFSSVIHNLSRGIYLLTYDMA